MFSIDQKTGEPTLIQNIDSRGGGSLFFTLDGDGRFLISANSVQRDEKQGVTIPASLTVFRIRNDGTLEYLSKYDEPGTGNWVSTNSFLLTKYRAH